GVPGLALVAGAAGSDGIDRGGRGELSAADAERAAPAGPGAGGGGPVVRAIPRADGGHQGAETAPGAEVGVFGATGAGDDREIRGAQCGGGEAVCGGAELESFSVLPAGGTGVVRFAGGETGERDHTERVCADDPIFDGALGGSDEQLLAVRPGERGAAAGGAPGSEPGGESAGGAIRVAAGGGIVRAAGTERGDAFVSSRAGRQPFCAGADEPELRGGGIGFHCGGQWEREVDAGQDHHGTLHAGGGGDPIERKAD